MKFKINLHSFVDVITNSSTEIYIQVGPKTIEFIERIVDTILKFSNNKLRCKDLFIFDITEEDRYSSYDFIDSYLTVTVKEGLPKELDDLAKYITSEIRDIFDLEACYEG